MAVKKNDVTMKRLNRIVVANKFLKPIRELI